MAGYLTALMAAGWTLGSLTSSGVPAGLAPRLMILGPLLTLAGMVTLSVLLPVSGTSLLLISLALFSTGLGPGLAWPHISTRVLKVASINEQALAGASITTVQLFATAMGAALAGMVASAGGLTDPGGIAGTAQAARWLFGLFALAPFLCFLISGRASRA